MSGFTDKQLEDIQTDYQEELEVLTKREENIKGIP